VASADKSTMRYRWLGQSVESDDGASASCLDRGVEDVPILGSHIEKPELQP